VEENPHSSRVHTKYTIQSSTNIHKIILKSIYNSFLFCLPRMRVNTTDRGHRERKFTITTNVTSGRYCRRNRPIRRCSISRVLGHGWSTAPLLRQPGHRRLNPKSCFWCSTGDYLERNVSGFFFFSSAKQDVSKAWAGGVSIPFVLCHNQRFRPILRDENFVEARRNFRRNAFECGVSERPDIIDL